MEADKYGSIARRKRVYVLAVVLHDQILMSKTIETHLQLLCMNLLSGMETGPGQISDFIDLSMASFKPQSEWPRDKARKMDPERNYTYKDEHYNMFECAGLAWPPKVQDVEVLSLHRMSERQQEVAVFLHQMFPWDGTRTVEFVDINPSLGRIMNAQGGVFDLKTKKTPWSASCPTLTSMCLILMRWRPRGDKGNIDPASKAHLRTLTGLELMQVMGWSKDMWTTRPDDIIDDALQTSLAGNAFSAFAVGPIITVGLTLAGCTKDDLPEVEAIEVESESLSAGSA